jgi:restriction system protein
LARRARRRRRRRRARLDAAKRLGLLCVVLGLASIGTHHLVAASLVIGGAALASFWVIATRHRRRRRRLRTLNGFLCLSPAGFEEAVADLARALGYRSVKRVGGPGDLAADITCRDSKGELVVIQCKRYRPGCRIGSAEVQKVLAMATVHHHAHRAILVATSSYTAAASKLAGDHGVWLIDGDALVNLAARASRRRPVPGPEQLLLQGPHLASGAGAADVGTSTKGGAAR